MFCLMVNRTLSSIRLIMKKFNDKFLSMNTTAVPRFETDGKELWMELHSDKREASSAVGQQTLAGEKIGYVAGKYTYPSSKKISYHLYQLYPAKMSRYAWAGQNTEKFCTLTAMKMLL